MYSNYPYLRKSPAFEAVKSPKAVQFFFEPFGLLLTLLFLLVTNPLCVRFHSDVWVKKIEIILNEFTHNRKSESFDA